MMDKKPTQAMLDWANFLADAKKIDDIFQNHELVKTVLVEGGHAGFTIKKSAEYLSTLRIWNDKRKQAEIERLRAEAFRAQVVKQEEAEKERTRERASLLLPTPCPVCGAARLRRPDWNQRVRREPTGWMCEVGGMAHFFQVAWPNYYKLVTGGADDKECPEDESEEAKGEREALYEAALKSVWPGAYRSGEDGPDQGDPDGSASEPGEDSVHRDGEPQPVGALGVG